MAERIAIDQLASKIVSLVSEYTTEVEEGVREAVFITADEEKAELKATSPVRKGSGGGKYAKGWLVRKTKGTGFTQAIVHNKLYQLVHLLEKGHALRNGGRARAFPHVAPVESAGEQRLLKRIADVVGGKR